MNQIQLFIKKSVIMLVLAGTAFIQTEAQNVVRVEYFVDNDPGFGAATGVNISTGLQDVTADFQFDIDGLSPGFHNLYIRSLVTPYQVIEDGKIVGKGGWSLTPVRTFYKETIANVNNVLPNITKGEYFIDTDPGFGSATNIPINTTPGSDLNNLSFTFDITSLTPGFHNLYMRFRDANGKWSLSSIRSFYKENLGNANNTLPNIVAAEYFIDADPGFGAGRTIGNLGTGSDLNNVNFIADITPLSVGFHQISTRFRDASGRWSQTNIRSFYKEEISTTAPLTNIVSLEYFVDTDPGFGSGTKLTVNPATDITTLSFPIDMTNVSIGNHKIYVRALNAAGKWSLVSNGSFIVEPPAAIYITVGNLPPSLCSGANLTVPFTVNTPYGSNNIFTAQLSDANGGFTNPVNIGTFTGNNNNTINGTLPANTAAGNSYRVRIISSSPLDTSAASSTAISVQRLPEQSFSITGAAQACIGAQTYSISTVAANTTYNWVLSGGGTMVANATSATINWTAAGTHTITVTPTNTCGNGQPVVLSVIVAAGTPTVTASGPLSFCQGGSVTLTSSATAGNVWSNGATTHVITVTANGIYSVTTGGAACPATSANTIVTVTPTTTATFAAIAPICAGAQPPILPAVSTNGIAGTWLPAIVSNTSTGNYTFTATAGQCILAPLLTVIVNPVLTLVFAAIPPIYAGSVAPLLPAISQNGITGTWSPATVSNTQTATYTFTPITALCTNSATLTVEVKTAPDLAVQNVTSSQTELVPGDLVTVSWNVANVGSAQSLVNWTEKIYIQSVNGQNRTLLKQSVYANDGVINVNQSIARTDNVTLPAQLTIGDEGVLLVELIPDVTIGELAGAQANNTGIQQTAINIRRLITLALSSNQITEGIPNGLTATVNRTGSFTNPLTVNITIDQSQRYTFPATVTIPAGQAAISFTVTAVDNAVIEGSIKDTMRIAAVGLQTVKAGFLLLDNDKASITITNLPAEAMEGATVTFRVSTNLAPATPLQVFLVSGNQLRFPVPPSVTIAAGAFFADVTVNLVQDNIPEVDIVVDVNAGAANQNASKASILVRDDDLPGLSLTIQTNIISEAAGFFATQATLRRTAGSNPIGFTVNLSASIPGTLILPPSISLVAGENEKTFTIGVIDNTLVDGERLVKITAAIFVNSCGCNAPSSSAGSVSDNITVSDNDGATLLLTANPLTLVEGAANAGLLKITRNTPTTQPLIVNLVSSNTGEATLPATATIPAGAAFVEVPITTINDGVTDGSKQVNFEATAAGFSPGTVWVLVTDLNKPDLQIPATTVTSASQLQAMTVFNYQVSVKNTGFATALSGVLVRGYLSLDNVIDAADTLVTEDIIPGAIAMGQTVQIVNAASVPDLPGQYKLIFWVNPLSDITELLVTNNTSQPLNVTINPDYTATAIVADPYFTKGKTIAITGKAQKSNGTVAANAAVEVYVITNGLRREIKATTNAAGNYTTEFVPMANEVGHYITGAGYPGTKGTAEQDAFDILGVRINNGEIPTFKVILGETITGSFPVQNLSNKSLTEFSLAKINLPNGATMRFDTLPVLSGNANGSVGFRITGSVLTAGTNFEVAGLQAVSKEGTIQLSDAFYYCQAPNGFIEASIKEIEVVLSPTAGERLVEFKLVNKGTGSSGTITVNLPQLNWLKSISPVILPALATGDSVLVLLKFSALAEVPFNFGIAGSIAINAQNGNSLSIPFNFKKVSETTGAIKITVTNQFTYYTDAAPKVQDAHVIVKNYYTGELYAEGKTDADGIFEATGIPEGTHKIIVEKEKHLPYNNTITINPGNTVESMVFLNYQAITFSWTVVPTAIQDEYEIILTTQFETNIPIPVVTIDMPKTMPQLSGTEVYAFNAILTNHGLITAKDVTLNLPKGDTEYEFVTNYVPADLLAQQSIQVPVIMRRRTGPPTGGRPSLEAISQFLGTKPPSNSTLGGGANCTDFTGVVYWYKCNLSSGLWENAGTLFTYAGRTCTSSGGGGVNPNVWAAYAGAFPTCALCPNPGLFAGDPNWTNPFKFEKKSCVDCLDDLADALSGCLDLPAPVKCYAKMLIQNGGPKEYALCLIEENSVEDVVEDLLSKIPIIGKLFCLRDLLGALATCLSSALERPSGNMGMRTAGRGELSSVLKQVNDNLQIVRKGYTAQVNWNTEYFSELSTNDGWTAFSPMVTPYVRALVAFPLAIQDSIIGAMAGYDIQPSAIQTFFIRWNKSIEARDLDILTPNTQYADIINWTLVKAYSDSLVDAHNYAVNLGFEAINEMHIESKKAINEIIEGQKNAVCASVTVQLSQKLTMTREAFDGTLEIFNGHPTDKMDSLSVNIQITDQNGVPGNGFFEIQTKSLSNLSDITGTGKIDAQQKGLVKFLFIPEIGAAPTAPKIYNFGGSVRYFDPYAQAMVTLPLASVQLTVNPSPNLFLHYFLERNILSDDPLTSPNIEPTVPAELAVMVENQGYGPAVNMLISSAQPKIIDNEKGLAINFSLIGSNFQGQPRNLGVTNINFGTIPPLETRIGQWYFTSSLLGKFISYEAKVVHNNSFGNPDLSLVKGIKLHELTRSIKIYGALDDGINDFLANDYFDVKDVPDIIYFSQGNRTAKVTEATSGSFSAPVVPPSFTNTLTVAASAIGWNFIKLNDPGNGIYELASVTRNDGQSIPLNNAWLTFVTLPVSQQPVYENKFHFVDTFSSLSAVTYTVVWKPKNFDVPKVIDITGLTSPVTSTQVQQLTVVFNKHIDPATFSFEDLTLTFQGGPNISTAAIKIVQIDTATFTIDLSAVTTGNGFYNLTVQAAEVKDIYGINGLTGKQITWTQFLTVPSVQAFLGIPAGNLAAAYDTIGVLFNLPIDVATVTPARFSIYKEGALVPGTITIDSVRADNKLFYLSGLGSILTQNGVYEFRVDLPNIKSETQEPGLQQQSINLTVDNAGPLLLSLEKSTTGGLDPQHVTFIKMKFNEEVFGFNTASIVLTKNGEILPLNIAQLSNTDLKNWMAGNFGLLTYGDGDYTLTVNLTGCKDAVGNSGIGLQQIIWIVNRSALVNISNLQVTPDLGYSNSDKVTSGQTLNVAFDLDANASQVTISQVDLSGESVLATVADVASGNVSLPFTLATGGNTGIKVTATGTNGGVGIAQQALFIDQLPLTAKWNFDPNQTLLSQVDNIVLSFSNRLLIETGLLDAIQLKRNGEIIATNKLSVEKINDTAFTIKGINMAGFVAGNYQLLVNQQPFNKYVSGIGGVGQASVSWVLQSGNRAPVANAGADFTITTPGIYSLNGSLSSDPDNDQFTYQWTAPAGVELTDANTATPSFNITTNNQGNKYLFLLLVSDGALFTTDVVEVTVNLQTTPVSFTGLSAVYCSNALPATLTGIPAGGLFIGPGISGNIFDPSAAGAGTHTIKYSKDGLNYEQTTTVNTAITPVFTGLAPICYGTTAPVLSASSVNGISGSWSPEVVSNTTTASYLFTPAAGQCATTVSLTVTVNSLPEVTLAPFNGLCITDAIVALSGGTPTGGIYSGETVLNGQFNPSVAGVGNFQITYTFTNSDGCTANASQNISVTDCNIPCTATASADGPVSFCKAGSVTLTASAGTGYLWSTGAVTQSIEVNSSGNYSVQVITGNCSATSAPINVIVNDLPAIPTISASGPTAFCTGGSVLLTSGAAMGNTWSNGATTQGIAVTTSGTFTVTVTNDKGCSATSTGIVVDASAGAPATPTASVTVQPTCAFATGTIVVTAPKGDGFTYSIGEAYQADGTFAGVASGIYKVTAKNGDGCISAETSVTVIEQPGAPATPTASVTVQPTCAVATGTIVVTAPTGDGFTYSIGGAYQANGTFTGVASGIYKVTAKNGDGCISAETSVTVIEQPGVPDIPTISSSGDIAFCKGGTVTLTSSLAAGYLWSNGAVTQSIIVNESGSYTVAVTNPAGCSSAPSTAIEIFVKQLPIVTLASFISVCNTATAFALSGGLPSGGMYSGQGVSNNQFNPAVAGLGTFPITYRFTNSDGCSAAATENITVTDCNTSCTAAITASGATTFCLGGSVVLTASQGTSYLWSNGATTQSITVNSSCTFTVKVTNAANCAAVSAPMEVQVNPLPVKPVISASCSTTFCVGSSVTLSTAKATAYLWSNGATTQSIKVTTGGNYTVTVKNIYGCSATSAITTVIVNDCPATYCAANGTRASKGFIQKVATYKGINNNSGWDKGYGDYLNFIIVNRLNGAFGVGITPGYKEANFINPTLFTRVWIDWNQDGDFTDAGELVFAPCKASNMQRKAWIPIPSTAKPGNTRMRIAMRADKAPSPCGSFTFGEVEDYTISIVASKQADSNSGNPADYLDEEEPGVNFSVYPNPASTNMIVERSGYNEDKAGNTMVTMQLIDVNGRILMQQRLINLVQAFDVSKFANGIYFVNIKTTSSTTVKKIVIQH